MPGIAPHAFQPGECWAMEEYKKFWVTDFGSVRYPSHKHARTRTHAHTNTHETPTH